MKKVILIMLVLMGVAFTVQAQEQQGEKKLVSEAYDEFNPYWYMQLQGGASYALGEADFTDLISPAAQVSVGYKFSKLFGARLAISGWQAKNYYSRPNFSYTWNYVQPSIDLTLDLGTLFAGWKPKRFFNPYAFIGGGAPVGINNDDALDAQGKNNVNFLKIWEDTKVFWAVRGGLGADFRISDHFAIGIEGNANMMPDNYNSKKGKNNGPDWQFNALVGLKFNFGKTYKHHDAVYEYVAAPAPKKEAPKETKPVVKEEPKTVVVEEPESQDYYVFFDLNKSVIRNSELSELNDLLAYMNENPSSTVQLTGYADKETGNKTINQRLSERRAAVVKDYLVNKGIAADRIATAAKGDTVQPFEEEVKNRVTIAVTNAK